MHTGGRLAAATDTRRYFLIKTSKIRRWRVQSCLNLKFRDALIYSDVIPSKLGAELRYKFRDLGGRARWGDNACGVLVPYPPTWDNIIVSSESCSKPSQMQLAPGPLYLLRNLPYFAIPSAIVYACLTLAKEHLSPAIPTWLTVFIAVLARPAIFIFNRHYSRFADNRNAAANNAVVAPHVRGSALSLISKLSRARKGYPGLILS